jgi:hypothetical protein
VSWRILASVLLVGFSVAVRAANSPDDRQTTDPKSVVSASNPAAGLVPIAQLYYTRSTFGPAWSPDGNQVVFTTNLTDGSICGKYRLRKDGRFSCCNRMTDTLGRSGLRMGNVLCSSRISAAARFTTCSRFRAMAGKGQRHEHFRDF